MPRIKIDLVQAFHRLGIEDSSKALTTFATRYGNFQYEVMPFGLANGPAHWQRFMNDSFRDMLDNFLAIYLDDLLIYTNGDRAQHTEHVRQVLRRLEELGLHADIDKSKFHKKEVKFLGMVVTTCQRPPPEPPVTAHVTDHVTPIT